MLRRVMMLVALVLIVAFGGAWAEAGAGPERSVPVAIDRSEPSVGPPALRIAILGSDDPGVGGTPTSVGMPGHGPRPSPRSDHDMAYDTQSDRIILFGGKDSTGALGDTWAYHSDTNQWTEMNPATSPSPRFLHAMAYDAESDRVILYGGVRTLALVPTTATWAYDYNNDTWTDLAPATKPPARWGRTAYDAESDRVVLFGGADGHLLPGAKVFNDTWAYDYNGNEWTEMSPRPSVGTSHAMAYDMESDRIVVFGGEGPPQEAVEGTWVYDLNNDSWVDRNPSLEPPLGTHYASAYDVESDRTILWGSFSPTTGLFVDDVWSYDLNANAWERTGTTAGPSDRSIHRMAYVTGSDRTIMFGGDRGTRFNNETWAYDLNGNLWTPLSPLTPPGAPRNLLATAAEGRVNLMWQPPIDDGGYAITNFRLYRGTISGSLSFATELGNVSAFSDPDVTMGTTYVYAVRSVTLAGEGPPSDEETVKVPDDLDPTVTITSPTRDETVNTSTITASGSATDNVAVQTVQVSTDGTAWTPATLTGSSWTAELALSVGPNTIHARAIDTSGNDATQTVPIEFKPDVGGGNGPGGIPPVVIAAIVGGIGAAAAAVGIFLYRRRA